jgi:flagellar hook-length control protein FliK
MLFKEISKHVPDEARSSTDSQDPPEAPQSADPGQLVTVASVIGVALASTTAVASQGPSSTETERAEPAQNDQPPSPQGIEAIPFVPQDGSLVQTHETMATEQDSAVTEAALSATPDLFGHPAQQSPLNPAQAPEVSAMELKQTAPRITEESPIRTGSATADLGPVPLKPSSADSILPGTSPMGSLIPDQGPSPVVEIQETKNLPAAASVNGAVHTSLDRPSTGIQPPIIVSDQGTPGTTPLGQSLSTMMMGERERGQEESSGADGQGQGEANLFRSRTTGTLESLGRDNQSPLFIDQFTTARQNQSSLGAGSPTGTPAAADQLKMTQAFLTEDRSSHTAVPETAHTVHMDLPTHDSGPLSVRISVTDQMVHTQFTTDRSDLGQFLLARQDQLQQDLTKSGLELGQFQVHINRHGQQEAPPEGQSRRQGEARGDSSPRQQAEQQDQDQKRQHARSIQALSVFA